MYFARLASESLLHRLVDELVDVLARPVTFDLQVDLRLTAQHLHQRIRLHVAVAVDFLELHSVRIAVSQVPHEVLRFHLPQVRLDAE